MLSTKLLEIPKTALRPETNVPSPAQLVEKNPWIEDKDLYEYVCTHADMLNSLQAYAHRPMAREIFWQQEKALQKIWQRVEPPPPYEP